MKPMIRATELKRENLPQGVRFISGRQVFDEALMDGRYLCRYRNCNGQIMPENRLIPQAFRQTDDSIPLQSFSLTIDGKRMDEFTYEALTERKDETGFQGSGRVFSVSLIDPQKTVRIHVMTRLDGSDFIIRWLTVENLTSKTMAVQEIYPLSGHVFDHFIGNSYYYDEVVEKGRQPYQIAYCHRSDWRSEGDFYFDELTEQPLSFGSSRGKSGFNRPAFWLRNNLNGETFVCEFGYSGNWKAQIDYRKTPNLNKTEFIHRVFAQIGIAAPSGEAAKLIRPGETIETPSVHFGTFRETDDFIVQALHTHVRNTIILPLPAGIPIMELEANHRGYLADHETTADIIKDAELAKKLGVELYMIDAGWYGNEPNIWYDNVGDWTPGPWMEDGLKPIADRVHELGMHFGLWAEFEAAGSNSTLRKQHPDWLLRRNGRLEAGGRALDLSKPEVEAHLYSEISRMIETYDLDMFRIDHNQDTGEGGTREEDGILLNTNWNYYEAFQRIFYKIHKNYPNVVLQNCGSGGGRMDFGTMRLFHNAELTDWLRSPRTMLIFNGTLMALPPEILLRTYGTEVEDIPMDADIDAQLRSVVISRPILRGIAPSEEELTPYLRDKIERYILLFKNFMRPMMKNCRVFHHTPFLRLQETTPWVVLEYASEDQSCGMASIFSLSSEGEKSGYTYRFRARGLKFGQTYRVTFLNSSQSAELSGTALTLDGIDIRVGHMMSSEMLLFEAL